MADTPKKTCFIIMPISTPEIYRDKYRDGDAHFKHVMECLFIPSVEAAGYEPIPPVAKGSDLIHAEIIKNLEMSDMVLCDMSCLNPNVFFEWGIRTALNKPVCIIKDEIPVKVPFDTGILNYEEYKSSIEPWELAYEIKKISKHIVTSHQRSKKENTLWKYFGIKTEALPIPGQPGSEDKLDIVLMQLDSLQRQIDEQKRSQVRTLPFLRKNVFGDDISRQIDIFEESTTDNKAMLIERLIMGLLPKTAGLGELKVDKQKREAWAQVMGDMDNKTAQEIASTVKNLTGFELSYQYATRNAMTGPGSVR